MAILPNSRPSTGWRRGDLTNNCIKEISMSAKLRYSRTATIKLWRQHLGAQLPGTLPLPLNVRRHQEQCSRHKTIGTIPRYPRDPKKNCEKLWRGKSKHLRQETSPERRRDRGVKRILLADIYNPKTQNIFVQDSTTSAIRSSRGLLSWGWLWLPICNTHYAAISPTCRGTT